MATRTFHGSCHCRTLQYEAEIDLDRGTNRCNCTYCRKIRSWKAFVVPGDFRVISGEADATTYGLHPTVGVRMHCPKCGVHVYERGNAEWMGGAFIGIYIATLDDATPEELAAAPVSYSDGLNNNWMSPPAITSYL